MSEEEVIERIKCRCFTGDFEEDHENADEIICDFLRLLGYEELVDVYESVRGWYQQKGNVMDGNNEDKLNNWCDKCHCSSDCEDIVIFLESDEEYCPYYA